MRSLAIGTANQCRLSREAVQIGLRPISAGLAKTQSPWSDDQVRREFRKAAHAAGIKINPESIFGTHSMRNSFRSWLDAAGASLAVQQKLMRHADIRTTMNVYGDIVTDEMTQAQRKISAIALNSTHNSTQAA